MELRQQLLRFVSRYQSIGWLLLFVGGGLLLQGLLWIVLPKPLYTTVISFLVLPARLQDLLVQPWSILTWPFFMLDLQIITLIFSGFVLWSFGQIHQHLLGDQRTRRLLILVVPLIGLLTVTISHFLPASPFEQGTSTTISTSPSSDSTLTEQSPPAEEPATTAAAPASSPRKELLANPANRRMVNLWFPSGIIPLLMVLVFSSATLVPSYPIQLMLLGRINLIWVAAILIVLELLWAVFITPMAFAIMLGSGLGFLHVYLLRKGTDITELIWSYYGETSGPKMTVKHGGGEARSRAQHSRRAEFAAQERTNEVTQEIIDGILDKISAKGYESLTREEKELLFKASTQKEDE